MKSFWACFLILLFLSIGLYPGIGGMAKVEYRDNLKVLAQAKKDAGDTTAIEYEGILYSSVLTN